MFACFGRGIVPVYLRADGDWLGDLLLTANNVHAYAGFLPRLYRVQGQGQGRVARKVRGNNQVTV